MIPHFFLKFLHQNLKDSFVKQYVMSYRLSSRDFGFIDIVIVRCVIFDSFFDFSVQIFNTKVDICISHSPCSPAKIIFTYKQETPDQQELFETLHYLVFRSYRHYHLDLDYENPLGSSIKGI